MINEDRNRWRPEGKRHGHIDGDLLVYSGAARYQNESDFSKLQKYLDHELIYIMDTVGLDDFNVYVTGGGNFRKEVYPLYKAHRLKQEKPKWLIPAYEYLHKEWAAIGERTYEADDLLGIAATEDPSSLVISYDKDLLQIPGYHYNWRKRDLRYVTEEEGNRFLALQCLMGDSADNIPGVKGIGPRKAEKLLPRHGQLLDYLHAVVEVYYQNNLDFNVFAQYYKCLKILRDKTKMWPELRELNDGYDDTIQ